MPLPESENKFFNRKNEISKLLHRSPDYVFLGELQNADDTLTAFEGFSAGVRGMATTHSKSFSNLLNRWTDSHKLSSNLIEAIDVIVICNKIITHGIFRYKVMGIYENGEENFHIKLN